MRWISAFVTSVAFGSVAWLIVIALGFLDSNCPTRSEKAFSASEMLSAPFGLGFIFLAFGVALFSVLHTAIPIAVVEIWIQRFQAVWVVVFSSMVTIGLNLYQFRALSESCGPINVPGFLGLVLIATAINSTQAALCYSWAKPQQSGEPAA